MMKVMVQSYMCYILHVMIALSTAALVWTEILSFFWSFSFYHLHIPCSKIATYFSEMIWNLYPTWLDLCNPFPGICLSSWRNSIIKFRAAGNIWQGTCLESSSRGRKHPVHCFSLHELVFPDVTGRLYGCSPLKLKWALACSLLRPWYARCGAYL